MTPSEYTTALTTLGLTTEQAAKWLGIGRSTAFRYAVDGAPGPVSVAIRQRLAIHGVDRYEECAGLGDYGYMLARPNGEWVRHSDLTAALGLPQ